MHIRKIVGVQVHHSVILDDASRYLTNACQALAGAGRMMAEPEEVNALLLRVQEIARLVSTERQAARLRLQMFQADPEFVHYVEGDLPWPDEDPDGFEARCRCSDRCLVHDQGLGEYPQDCNCDEPCRRHAA